MPVPITASMLYDLISCSHRVHMDVFGDQAEKDAPNPFIQMLWEKGTIYEKEVIEGLDQPFLDLSIYSGDEKERRTTEAMRREEPLIYSARIKDGGLLGDPDVTWQLNVRMRSFCSSLAIYCEILEDRILKNAAKRLEVEADAVKRIVASTA